MDDAVVFVQQRAGQAGAQVCLSRLIRHELIKPLNPVLVTGSEGWLTEECDRAGVPRLIEPFPKSRTITGRLAGNAGWAKRVAKGLTDLGCRPVVVHANDHLEGLLSLHLANQNNAGSVMLMRSGGMTERDFAKYRCGEFDRVLCAGEELADTATAWSNSGTIEWVPDGIHPDEFMAAKPKPATFPARVLVIGTPAPGKGWGDVIDALCHLHEQDALPNGTVFDFNGDKPEVPEWDQQLHRLPTGTCRFVGRNPDFRETVRGYDLVINPSRFETMGMAAIEVLAAGVPLLSSLTGAMGHVLQESEFVFPSGDVIALAERIAGLNEKWATISPPVAECQQRIRDRFLIEKCAARMSEIYRSLFGE